MKVDSEEKEKDSSQSNPIRKTKSDIYSLCNISSAFSLAKGQDSLIFDNTSFLTSVKDDIIDFTGQSGTYKTLVLIFL